MAINIGNTDFHLLPTNRLAKITGVHESLLQECEKDIIWYRENFFGKTHRNYLALDSPKGPIALSLIHDDGSYKVILRTNQGSERLSVQDTAVVVLWWRKILGFGPSVKSVIEATASALPGSVLKSCYDPKLPNELLSMEEKQVIRSYKFGVTYLKAGQSTEEEMFKNRIEDATPAFHEFLLFLGEKIELQGWKGYRGGLDVNSNMTGTHSVYTKWQGYEVMYHVAPLLPFNQSDTQQLERKRHVGNDIVVVVFQDSATPFELRTLTSKQNHVVVCVRPEDDGYRLCVCAKSGVPAFSPELPEPCHVNKDAVSRDFFLHKLINAERASYKAPSFAPKIQRTRSVLLKEIAQRFVG